MEALIMDALGEYPLNFTQKERVIAQIEHSVTDFIPYTLDFEGDVANRLDSYFGSNEWRRQLDSAIRILPIPSYGLLVNENAQDSYTDLFGTAWRVDKRPFHPVRYPLSEPSLEGFVLPPVEKCFDPDWDDRSNALLYEWKHHFVVGFIGFGLFERTWALRGFENVLSDIILEPSFYEDLLERLTIHQMALVERILTLPVDGIMFSDDWGYQRGVLVGAARWRKFLKPRLARMYEQVHKVGKFTLSHCCGSITEIIPDLIEIGLDVLQSIQPEAEGMNPDELKRNYGAHITFWGGLGSQSTVPFCSPTKIKAEILHLCRVMGEGGGYILAPAKDLQPDTPTENAAAVVESFLEQSGVVVKRS